MEGFKFSVRSFRGAVQLIRKYFFLNKKSKGCSERGFLACHLPGVDEEDIEVDVGGEEDLVEGAARHRPRHRQPHEEDGVEGRSQRQRHRLRERESLERRNGQIISEMLDIGTRTNQPECTPLSTPPWSPRAPYRTPTSNGRYERTIPRKCSFSFRAETVFFPV